MNLFHKLFIIALFLGIFTGCASKPPMDSYGQTLAIESQSPQEPHTEDSMEKARQFVAQHEERVAPVARDYALAYWKGTTTGDKEAYEQAAKLEMQLRQLHSDKEEFAALKLWKESEDITHPTLIRQIAAIHDAYAENLLPPDLMAEMVHQGVELVQLFNTHRGRINGQEVTSNQILEILTSERRSGQRKAAWEASKQVGPIVAERVIRLVKIRNEAAKSLGYDNYYQMKLLLNEQDPDTIKSLFEDLVQLTQEPYSQLKGDLDQVLAKRYGIKPEDLRPWHYEDPFFQEPPNVYHVDFDTFYKDKDMEAIAKRFFESMGLKIGDILEASDLYEKSGKEQHAYCIDIDRNGDVRMLTNLKGTEAWMGTLLHELGHAVYFKYHSPQVAYSLRQPAHTFTTEAIAQLFGRLSKNPHWISRAMDIPETELTDIGEESQMALRLQMLVFARWSAVMVHFERQLYEDPDRDLNALWWDLVESIQMVTRPEGRDAPDWSTKIHIVSAPVYYHNYILGEMLASQLASTISKRHFQNSPIHSIHYFDSKDVGKYLIEEIFEPGALYHWNELIKRATGEPLNPKFFVEEFVAD